MRVSFVGARKGQAFRSPVDQEREIEDWARRQGREVRMLDPELDRKGSDSDRPIFRQAVDGVKSGRFSGVVVAYLSRAGRDLRLMLDLWDEVEGAGGVVFSARENIDGSTAAGRLHRNLLASIHQHELEERREGFERQVEASVADGIWQRRQTPRGYSRDPDTRRLVCNEQADEVRGAARDLLAGVAVMKIADGLGMTPGGVRAMLHNRVYLGELRVRSYTNPDAHEPILDPETFDALQTRLAGAPRPGRKGRPPALLAKLVRCAGCGHAMTRGSGGVNAVYSCPVHHSGARCPEPASITCRLLDAHVERVALSELERVKARLAQSDRGADLRSALLSAQRDLSEYLAAVDAAGIGSAAAAEGMRVRHERVEGIEAEIAAESVSRLPSISVASEFWDSASVHEQGELLRNLFAAVVVKRAGRGRKVAVDERTRVLRWGARLDLPRTRGGEAGGIVPIRFGDLNRDDVVGVATLEDSPER
jgi:DNA invertase Pin-like site-specific DNA recombinase